MDWLVYILGGAASACFIAANYILNRRISILLLILGSSILVVQFGPVTGLWGLAALNFLFVLRNISFNIKALEGFYTPMLWGWLAVLYSAYIFVTLNNGGFNLLTTIPLFAIFFNVIALAQKDLLLLKVFLTLNSIAWVSFDLVGGFWGNLIGDLFGAIAGSIAVFRLMKKKREEEKGALV